MTTFRDDASVPWIFDTLLLGQLEKELKLGQASRGFCFDFAVISLCFLFVGFARVCLVLLRFAICGYVTVRLGPYRVQSIPTDPPHLF